VEARLTQRELAKLTGIAQAHISQMEGAMHNVCIDTMVTLSRHLKKPLSKLFEI
jgi:transcriptional regulator with XRE-family HTH domain